MSEMISKYDALECFTDWIDRYGNEHTADEDAVYQRIAQLPAVQPVNIDETPVKKAPNSTSSRSGEGKLDLISRRVAIEALDCINGVEEVLRALPSAQPEIIFCKDCRKHNHAHGYYCDGTFIGIMDCCPLIEIRGKAQGHEFDYQYCVYAERRMDYEQT